MIKLDLSKHDRFVLPIVREQKRLLRAGDNESAVVLLYAVADLVASMCAVVCRSPNELAVLLSAVQERIENRARELILKRLQ